MKTGTRTQVAVTARSGRPRILRDSWQYFCSSSVSSEPSSTIVNCSGITLYAIGHRVHRRGREVDRRAVEGEVGGPVGRLGQLLGELAHRVEAATRDRLVRGRRSGGVRPASSCRGLKTGMATMVVQFGLATMPLGIDASASALASGTTSGTSGSRRQADELSMTMAPAAARRGASSRETAGGGAAQGEVDAREVGRGRVLDRRCPRRPRAALCRRSGPRPGTAWT